MREMHKSKDKVELSLDNRQIFFQIRHKDRTMQQVVRDRLADLALSTSTHSTGFVTEDTFRQCADQTP